MASVTLRAPLANLLRRTGDLTNLANRVLHRFENLLQRLAGLTMLASALLLHGPGRLRTILEGMGAWLEQNEYVSVNQLRGSMSQVHVAEPAAFERAHYLRTVGTFFFANRIDTPGHHKVRRGRGLEPYHWFQP